MRVKKDYDNLEQILVLQTVLTYERLYYMDRPDKDPREMVFELRKLNNLQDSATIYPNQTLRLPH